MYWLITKYLYHRHNIVFQLFRNNLRNFVIQIINLYLDINNCYPDPCQNGGTCVDGDYGYTCNCPAGFTGVNCQTSNIFVYV